MLHLTAITYETEVKELKDHCFKLMSNESVFMDMDGETLELMQKMFKLLDTSTELVVEQAKTIDRLDDKLDKLLKLVEEKA